MGKRKEQEFGEFSRVFERINDQIAGMDPPVTPSDTDSPSRIFDIVNDVTYEPAKWPSQDSNPKDDYNQLNDIRDPDPNSSPTRPSGVSDAIMMSVVMGLFFALLGAGFFGSEGALLGLLIGFVWGLINS